MRFHMTALALVGWYLLVAPPRLNNGHFVAVDFAAPLSRWTHAASFDTAAECETIENSYPDEVKRDPTLVPEFRDALLAERTKSFRCIATDDPRLK